MKYLAYLHFIFGIIVMIDGFLEKGPQYGYYQHRPGAAKFLFAFIPILNIPLAISALYRWIKFK